jgi:hypothetical protein
MQYYIKFSNGSISDWFFDKVTLRSYLLNRDYIIEGENAFYLFDRREMAQIVSVTEIDLMCV